MSSGGAVNFRTRLAVFIVGDPLLAVGRALRTPRSMTIEAANLDRLTSEPRGFKKKSSKDKREDQRLEDLKRAVAEDRLQRDQEEKLRLEIYGELTIQNLQSLIVSVSAEEFDRAERESFGRPGIFSFEETRTCVGVDVSSPFAEPDHFEPEEELAEDASEENEEEESPTEAEDLRTAEESLEEFEHATKS